MRNMTCRSLEGKTTRGWFIGNSFPENQEVEDSSEPDWTLVTCWVWTILVLKSAVPGLSFGKSTRDIFGSRTCGRLSV